MKQNPGIAARPRGAVYGRGDLQGNWFVDTHGTEVENRGSQLLRNSEKRGTAKMKFACRERQRILLDAAIWQSLLQQSPSEENRSRFAAWLTKSRQHVEIYLYVAVRFPEFLETQPATPMLAPGGNQPTNSHNLLAWISAIGVAASLAAVSWFLWTHFAHSAADRSCCRSGLSGRGFFSVGTGLRHDASTWVQGDSLSLRRTQANAGAPILSAVSYVSVDGCLSRLRGDVQC